MQETRVQSLGQEDLLEKEMATHSSILAWRIPWTEEPGGLQSTGLQRVGHNRAFTFTLKILRAITKVSVIVKCYWHCYCHSEKRFLTKVSYRRKRTKPGKASKKCKWILRTMGNNQRFEIGEDHHCLKKKKKCHWKEAPLLTFSWDNLSHYVQYLHVFYLKYTREPNLIPWKLKQPWS